MSSKATLKKRRCASAPALASSYTTLPNFPTASWLPSQNKLRLPQAFPLQTDLVQGYGDDSAEIQKAVGGVPTVNMVVPIRYTHAHNGIMNRQDFDRTVELLVAMLQNLDASTVQSLRDFAPR